MLIKEGETFLIKNWDKYQSIDKYENYQIQNRERQRKYREKLKSESEKSNVTITENNEIIDNTQEKNTRRWYRIKIRNWRWNIQRKEKKTTSKKKSKIDPKATRNCKKKKKDYI